MGELISSLFQFASQTDLQLYLVWDLPAKIQGKELTVSLYFGESRCLGAIQASIPAFLSLT